MVRASLDCLVELDPSSKFKGQAETERSEVELSVSREAASRSDGASKLDPSKRNQKLNVLNLKIAPPNLKLRTHSNPTTLEIKLKYRISKYMKVQGCS